MTVTFDWTMLAWAASLIGMALAAFALLIWQLVAQHRRLALGLQQLGAEVSIFADASVAVAQTVEQAIVKQIAGEQGEGAEHSARQEVLQLARRRLSQGHTESTVQQALGLTDDETRLMAIGHNASLGSVAVGQPQDQAATQPMSAAARRPAPAIAGHIAVA